MVACGNPSVKGVHAAGGVCLRNTPIYIEATSYLHTTQHTYQHTGNTPSLDRIFRFTHSMLPISNARSFQDARFCGQASDSNLWINLELVRCEHHHQYMDELDAWALKEARFEEILWEGDPRDTLYVYWVCHGNRIKPAILKGIPFDGLYQFLQEEYGQQTYSVMVRRGKVMKFTGEISIGIPFNFVPRKDIRLEIERRRDEEFAKKKRSRIQS